MDYKEPSTNKTSTSVVEDTDSRYSYVLAIEFPDEDQKVYVKLDSPLFSNCLRKFDNEHDAQAYANEQFPGLIHYIEKIK